MNKSLAIQLGKNLQTSNNQVPQVQVHIAFRCVDLEKHFTKKRMSHLHRYCLSQKLLQEKYAKRRKKKSVVRDEIVVNKTNCQTKIKKTKKTRKSLFCKVSSNSESEVELVLESDTCTEESDDEVIEGDFVVVKVEGKYREVRYIAQVDTIDGDEFEGTFLKKVPQIVGHMPVFIINKTDIAAFQRNDMIAKLPEPVNNSGSTRKSNQLVFPVDITDCLN